MPAELPTWRPWADALPPQARESPHAPLPPYALLNEAEQDMKTTYSQVFIERHRHAARGTVPAGFNGAERPTAAQSLPQHGAPVGRDVMTTYEVNSRPEALARHHRRLQKNHGMQEEEREARWYHCFRRMEDSRRDRVSEATGTDYSVLPAGYVPKQYKMLSSKEADAPSLATMPPATRRSLPERPCAQDHTEQRNPSGGFAQSLPWNVPVREAPWHHSPRRTGSTLGAPAARTPRQLAPLVRTPRRAAIETPEVPGTPRMGPWTGPGM